MSAITEKDLIYKDYSWKAVPGDDQKKRKKTLTALAGKKSMRCLAC